MRSKTKHLSVSPKSRLSSLPPSGLYRIAEIRRGIAKHKNKLEETERKAKEQAALSAIAMAASQSLESREILQNVLDKVLKVTGRERGTIRFKDPVTGEVSLCASRGFSHEERAELLRGMPNHISERIFSTGKPLIVNDRAEIDASRFLLSRSRSMAWIPIRARQRVLGVLAVSAERPIPFSRREKDFLQAAGNVIGVALENAWLYLESKQQQEIQKLLKELSQDITVLGLEPLLTKIAGKVRELFRVDMADFRIIEKGAAKFIGRSGEGSEQLIASRSIRGRMRWILENHRPLLISDTTVETDLPTGESVRRLGIRGYFAVPLFSRSGEIIGVLRALTYEPREFNQDQADLLQQLANGAAIAIENSQLYEQVRQKVRELQQKTEELERANKVKDEFLSIMSHELRTPLNVVVGYAGLIREGLLGETNPDQNKALDKLVSRATDLLGMITGILYATHIEANQVQIEIAKFALVDLLDDLRQIYATPLGKPVTINWDYPRELPAVTSDRDKLKSILQNLVSNAVKFTERGQIAVSVRAKQQAGEGTWQSSMGAGKGENEWIEFKVADTGIGISKETLQVIFHKFRQADSSETRLYGGVGLGLYIAKNFTELLDGRIEVETEEGKGSVFTVKIPCAIHFSAMTGPPSDRQKAVRGQPQLLAGITESR